MKLIFIILFHLPLFVYGQYDLEGVIQDSVTAKAVPFATVFINGTTKGSTTDDNGFFAIKNISLPAQLITSHVSYSTKMTNVNNTNLEDLIITLEPRNIKLPEAVVKDKNLRQKNIDEFKRQFLGTNRVGKKAVLENDDVLIFSRSFNDKEIVISDSIKQEILLADTKGIIRWREDSMRISIKVNDIKSWTEDSTKITITEPVFIVEAREPLIIDLPHLGYKLQVDLVNFSVQNIEGSPGCFFKGYYYYQPYQNLRKSKIRKYKKNRQAVYYNSTLHFLRSLYENQLEQNGYQILETVSKEKIDIKDHLTPIENNSRKVIDLENKNLSVYYNRKMNGKPVDINKQKTYAVTPSRILFLSDTCSIRADGTTPDNNILFGGKIGGKRVGSMLPSDYNIDAAIK
jgi:hypothetical protein